MSESGKGFGVMITSNPMELADLAGFFISYNPELHATIQGPFLGVYTRGSTTRIRIIWAVGNGVFLSLDRQTPIKTPERIYRISLLQEEQR